MVKEFLDKTFLLENNYSEIIYENIKDLPILDYHCHLDAREIYENKPFETITDAWLKHDHYKWRAMRIMGINEENITSFADKYHNFVAWASVLNGLIGHPLYHFSHLELKNYFKINKPLSKATAYEIYNEANERLSELTPKRIIKDSNVELIITTNDPLEDLYYHKKLANDKDFDVKVLPAFRPDKAINIDKDGFFDYIKSLGNATKIDINDIEGVKKALLMRLEYFFENGAIASDHGLDFFVYEKEHEELAKKAFAKIINGTKPDFDECNGYKCDILLFLAKEYHKRGMVMELHFGVSRNNNTKMFKVLGSDCGFDTIRSNTNVDKLVPFLDELDLHNCLPKTVIFSLNPNDNVALATIMGSFCQNGTKGHVQQGAAWWFNDTKIGIERHLEEYSSFAPIDSFIGMLTDSRSLLSYARHEYFRRILANYFGKLLNNGEYPAQNLDSLINIAKNICYFNAKRYFLDK